MKNLYHILHKTPVFAKEEMEIEYEELALELMESGLVRIDTELCRNFVNFLDPDADISITLSKEELNPKLIEQTKNKLINLYAKKFSDKALENKLKQTLVYFQQQMSKNVELPKDLMLKIIRVFIQSTHPIVIRWALIERAEMFISYSYNIGDVMDVVNWQQSGRNSGMQSTDGKNACVFVSCGGDPFAATDANHPTYGDGWPALARIQIIAGQELGHYSDIKRDGLGRQIGRHSANFSCTRATDHVKIARKQDITQSNGIYEQLVGIGLTKLIEQEGALKFYRKNKVFGIKVLFLEIKLHFYTMAFLSKAQKLKMSFVSIFKQEEYLGSMIQAMIYDMLFNLTPQADVYNKQDPEEDEAIKCIEALARVPQQAMKWGYVATKALMPGLYQIYYGQVIPSLIDAYNNLTGEKYQRNYAKVKTGIIYKIRKLFTKNQIKSVREL
jgi:hypothetical protein